MKMYRNDLVEEESKEEFIYDIVNGVVEAACNTVFDKIIKSRVQPYAILCAKEMIMELIGVSSRLRLNCIPFQNVR